MRNQPLCTEQWHQSAWDLTGWRWWWRNTRSTGHIIRPSCNIELSILRLDLPPIAGPVRLYRVEYRNTLHRVRAWIRHPSKCNGVTRRCLNVENFERYRRLTTLADVELDQ